MTLAIGIPAYNEEKNIASIILKLKEIADMIIVCDDGSSDQTGAIARALGATVITHKKNSGYGAAIMSIFREAKRSQPDIFVTFDADGQHRVEDIEKIIEPIRDNKVDIVIGSRFLDESVEEVPRYRKLGIKVITKVTNSSIKEKITDSQSGFRAYNKKILEELTLSEHGMGISTEILIKANSKGFSIGEVPIKILYNENSSTHNPVSHGTGVLISTIKFTSIEHPLKFYGIPAVIFFIIGCSFTYLAIQYYAEVGRLNTNLTIVSAGTMIISIVLIITAILLYSLVSVVREK